MATYYVDYVGGADTNNGTTTGTSWQHCPGDTNATNNASTCVLVPGDIVYFHGGVTYEGYITPGVNGTSGHPITYDGSTWGGAKSIFDLGETIYHAFVGNVAYITITGFDFQSAAHSAGVANNLGIIRINAVSNWTITDCIFRYVQSWDILCALGSGGGVTTDQYCIFARENGSDYLTVDGCEFYAIGETAITLFRSDNAVIKNCNFGGISRGAESGYFSVAIRIEYNSSALTIQDCSFHDGWQYEGDELQGRCHAGDWIHIYGNSGTSEYPNDILIERCFFYNDKAFGYSQGTAFSMMETNCYDITWRNNLFINPHAANGSLLIQDPCDYIYIYNNTFVTFGASTGAEGMSCVHIGAGSGNNIEVKNNIFINLTTQSQANIHVNDIGWAGVSDYNTFYRPSDSESVCRRVNTWYTLAGWQGLGYDAHSYGTPNLTSLPATGATSSSGNYRLTSGSTNELDHADDLSSLFTDDYSGALRSLPWDIGAYDFSSITSSSYVRIY
jgi:hypothetical protein